MHQGGQLKAGGFQAVKDGDAGAHGANAAHCIEGAGAAGGVQSGQGRFTADDGSVQDAIAGLAAVVHDAGERIAAGGAQQVDHGFAVPAAAVDDDRVGLAGGIRDGEVSLG